MPEETPQFQIEVHDSLGQVSKDAWNALVNDGNPFLRYEFLSALENTDCLGSRSGWYPRYFLLWSSPRKPRELLGAVPTYIKTNSYGEFVFDWAWADAYQQHDMEYYPKLVSSIPFTPATGRRLLTRHDQPRTETVQLLAAAVRQYCDTERFSSLHWLFLTESEADILCATPAQEHTFDAPLTAAKSVWATDHLRRIDCQYHWRNRSYATFDDYLAQCTAKRRKTIRRERRHVSDKNIRLEQRMGDSLTAQEWRWVHDFYESTFDRKWGNPSLTLAFFMNMGETFGDHVLIVFAYDDLDATPDHPIACSVMFSGKTTLYGRYWGCRKQINSLHFETCYYQGIDYCIRHGLDTFEPGAQGEHKITRGFEPTITRSAHYIAHPGFREAVSNFLVEETIYVEQKCSGLSNLLPFKSSEILI